MEFGILGPLEVHDDAGCAIPLHGSKQRSLLALLLLEAGRVVSSDGLVDELWGAEPPASGTTALRVRVSELRKALGEGAPIATTPPGYTLQVDAEQIDAHRFERLLEEGTAALRRDAFDAAASTLREALALWRGPALADVADEPFARPEALRLDELRLVAREELIEAGLGLGRHAELVSELEALVAAEPLRERPRAQLMVALYRSGRTADALAAYRDARRVLVDELGIEPSPVLAELERRILRHDASLGPGNRLQREGRAPEEVKLATVAAFAFVDARDAESAASAVEEAGGRIETIAENELVAVFGAPVAQEDHAQRALDVAREVCERLGASASAGVATGEVVTGEAALAGHALAAAQALLDGAAPGTVAAGERTAAAASRTGRCTTPFVGRTRELETLRAAYRRAVDDTRPQLVTVFGDAGVGKSRLMRELSQALSDETPRPLLRTGRCLPPGRGTAYLPLAEVLRVELGLLETDSSERVRAGLGERQVLALTLGLEVAGLHPMAAAERLHAAWVELLGELVAARPVALLVEDLHWGQEQLLALLERIVDSVGGPLFVVATARPELLDAQPAWGRRRYAQTMWLEPLADDEARRMLDGLAAAQVPESVRETVLARAEGNPFFLEELVASILEQDSRPGLLPDTVQAVLAARIDLLPDREKGALQAAAVIGRVFWHEPVAELLGAKPDLALLEARDFVRRHGASSLGGTRELAFKHALTRDVAYGTIPRDRRAHLHAAFASWLERAGGARDEHAAALAHHYHEAVRPGHADPAWESRPTEFERGRRKALAWLLRAAELAVARYEIDEGVALLEHALELESSAAGRVELWRRLGRAYALKYDAERFLNAMERAIELCTDRATLGDLYAELANETSYRAGMWRQRPDIDVVDGWISRALEHAAPDSAARARALLALVFWNPEGGREAAREAVEIAERLDDPELRSYAYDAQAITLIVRGNLGDAYKLELRRFEFLDRITDPEHVGDIYYAPITASVSFGRFDEARELAQKHEEICAPLTPHHRTHGSAVLIELEELAGRWDNVRALQPLVEARAVDNAETRCVRDARSLLVCALAHTFAGNEDEARRLEEAAEAMRIEGFGHVLDTPRLELALARGDLGRAEQLVEKPPPDRGWHRGWLLLASQTVRLDALAALGRADALEAWPAVEPGTYVEPFLLRARGLVHGDAALVDRAVAGFEALGLHWHAGGTRVSV